MEFISASREAVSDIVSPEGQFEYINASVKRLQHLSKETRRCCIVQQNKIISK